MSEDRKKRATGAPTSGAWTEQYKARSVDGPESPPTLMDCDLKFARGRVTGSGVLGDVRYQIEGTFDEGTGTIRFRKRYVDGELYVYVGARNGAGFEGRWRLVNGAEYGSFELVPGPMATFDASARGAQALFRRRAKAWQKVCDIDLESVRFDGEKKILAQLLEDEDYVRALQSFHAEKDATDDDTLQRGELSAGRIRLSRRMMPGLFAVVDRCKAAIGLRAPVELFCINDATLNALVTTTAHGHIVIDVTSGTIDAFDDDELAYIIGHELGHALLGHLETFRAMSGETKGITSLRSFALKRYQELSADRMGLLCCPDLEVVLRAEMMFTTGVRRRSAFGTARAFLEHAKKVTADVAPPSEAAEGLDTHPYGELRAVAIDLFYRSQTFAKLRKKTGGTLSEAQLEAQVEKIVKRMNPSVLDAQIDRDDVAEFVLLGAIAVAEATRGTSRAEARVIAQLAEGYRRLHAKLVAMPMEDQQLRLVELAESLALALSYPQREKILEDLVLVARADGRVSKREREALEGVSGLLALNETAVDEVLESFGKPLD
ncbi:MAG: M48 family metalloprotease [Myxococcales bacterium]|nr:M48 family metalloprotease [Myxococcales bacterium]